MPLGAALLLAVTALVGVIALVAHDTFFAHLQIQPEDAGASDLEIVVRGMVYIGLALVVAAAAATVGAAAARWAVCQSRWPGAATGSAIVIGALSALLASLLSFGGLRGFVGESWLRIVAIVVLALLLSAVVTLVLAAARKDQRRPAVIALVLIAIAVIPSVLLAGAGGRALADRVRHGHILEDDPGKRLDLRPGAFDPLQMRAEPACILPRGGTPEEVSPARKYVLLGQSAGAPLLYDIELRRAFHVPPERIGVLGVANDVCRRPGDPVPVETSSPAEDAALARLYRPILRFDSRERWRPLNIEAFVSERFEPGSRRHQVCTGEQSCSDLQSAVELSRSRDRIDVHGSGVKYKAAALGDCKWKAPSRDCEDSTSAIYYHVRREDRRAYIDYWWFFRFNHFPNPVLSGGPCGGPPTPGSQHEGDWEGITVVTAFNRPDKVSHVAFASHGHSVRYPTRTRKSGPTVVEFAEGTSRPHVYVACGSHAAYPRSCEGPKDCRQTAVRGCGGRACRTSVSTIAEAPFDGGVPWHRNDDADCFPDAPAPVKAGRRQTPASMQAGCLVPLPSTPSADGPRPAEWTAWPGTWGVSHGPRSPANQGRYRRPWEMVPSRRTSFDDDADRGKPPAPRSDDGKPGPGVGAPGVAG